MHLSTLTPQQVLDMEFGNGNLSPFEIITNKRYRASIPRSTLYLLEPDRLQNDFISGDSAYDRERSLSRIPAYITIEHMLAIWSMGLKFSLTEQASGREVYEVLSLHIKACLLHNQNVFRGDPVDLLSLKQMDEFLADVFASFRYEIQRDNYDDNDARERFNKLIGGITKSSVAKSSQTEHTPILSEERITDDFDRIGALDGFGADLDDFDFGGETWT